MTDQGFPTGASLPPHPVDLERRLQVAEGLRGILAVLNSDRSLEEILDYIVGEARRLLGADAAAVYRLLPDRVLSIQSSQGLSAEYVAQADIPLGQLATGQAVVLRQPVTLENLSEILASPEDGLDPPLRRILQQLAGQYQSVLSTPLITKNEPSGTLTLYYLAPRRFTPEDLDMAVAFSDQTALAIDIARMRERSMEEAITTERGRLARELHDSVTQMLFSASLIAEVLPVVWTRDPGEGRAALGELRQLTRGALAEMRALLLELRPAGLLNARLEDLLRQQSEAVAGRMRTPVEFTVAGQIELPADARLALYRIAQEALNNIARHAGAARVSVRLTALANPPRGVELHICDDGCGFNPNLIPSDHLGLGIMRERAASVKAEIEISSQPGLGTDIRVRWSPPPERETRHDQ